MTKQILKELKKFDNTETIHQVKSFVIFNLSASRKDKLLKRIQKTFSLVSNNLKTKRTAEIKRLRAEDTELAEIEYDNSELYKRYKDTPLISEIMQNGNDKVLQRDEYIANKNTYLKELLDWFRFEDINLKEIQKKVRILDELHQKWDFSHLAYKVQGKLITSHDKLNNKERNYMRVKKYLHRKQLSKYIFNYNSDYQPTDNPVFEKLFYQQFKWDWLKWSIFAFGISKQKFEKHASETVKKELYLNRIIIP